MAWYVLDYEKDGLCYAIAIRINHSQNLVPFIKDHVIDGGLRSMNLCTTKKEAFMIAEAWNNSYKECGIHMFSQNGMPF